MNYKVSQIKVSAEVAQQKIMSWCAYQERSQHETRQKLYQYGIGEEDVEAIIANLISENFLNEERFAKAFVSGKLRIKHWGRNKIKVELKKHKLSEACVKIGLKSIDLEEYIEILKKVIEKKTKSIPSNHTQKTFYVVLNYLISRGFESDLVRENLGILRDENS
jgi:regulatory protein